MKYNHIDIRYLVVVGRLEILKEDFNALINLYIGFELILMILFYHNVIPKCNSSLTTSFV